MEAVSGSGFSLFNKRSNNYMKKKDRKQIKQLHQTLQITKDLLSVILKDLTQIQNHIKNNGKDSSTHFMGYPLDGTKFDKGE